jgi:hypothetical protein
MVCLRPALVYRGLMFAALIRSGPDVMKLAATLSVLVEGAAAGLIGHAVVIAPAGGQMPEIERLADATGAELVTGTGHEAQDWRAAALVARGDWLLLMQAGEMPGQNWVQALERHAMTAQGKPGLMPRMGWKGFAERWLPPSRAGAGFVLPKPLLLAGNALRPQILGVNREGQG